jgi:hypothetical protein
MNARHRCEGAHAPVSRVGTRLIGNNQERDAAFYSVSALIGRSILIAWT